MANTFDEAYARYLSALAQLDQTDVITEKNAIFRQLTKQLSDLEMRLNNDFRRTVTAKPETEEPDGLVEWEATAVDRCAGKMRANR